jgi:hypothetical protein
MPLSDAHETLLTHKVTQTDLTQRGEGRTPQTGSPCNLHDSHGHLSKGRMEWEEDPPKRGSIHPCCPHSTPTWSNHLKKAKKYYFSPEKASICLCWGMRTMVTKKRPKSLPMCVKKSTIWPCLDIM